MLIAHRVITHEKVKDTIIDVFVHMSDDYAFAAETGYVLIGVNPVFAISVKSFVRVL